MSGWRFAGKMQMMPSLRAASISTSSATYPLIYAAARYNPSWFYPAFMIVVGAHYLWFIFLYGMRAYGALAAILIGSGIALGVLAPNVFPVGGWLAAVILLSFAGVIWLTHPWMPRRSIR